MERLLEREERWMGEGVSQILGLGLAQHPAFVQVERARLRGAGQPEVWTEAAVAQAARARPRRRRRCSGGSTRRAR